MTVDNRYQKYFMINALRSAYIVLVSNHLKIFEIFIYLLPLIIGLLSIAHWRVLEKSSNTAKLF